MRLNGGKYDNKETTIKRDLGNKMGQERNIERLSHTQGRLLL